MATHAVAAEGASDEAKPADRPYAPSWLDSIVGAIERLPWPHLGGLFRSDRARARICGRGGSTFVARPVRPGSRVLRLCVWLRLPDSPRITSCRAAPSPHWEAFRPATDINDAQAARWRAELSTTPAKPAAVIYVAAVVGYLTLLAWSPQGFDLAGHQPAFVAMRVLSEAFWLAPLTWMVVYLIFRQTRIVSQLHRSVVRVDLLQPGPIHAMSRLTARNSVALLVIQLFLVLVPLPNVSEIGTAGTGGNRLALRRGLGGSLRTAAARNALAPGEGTGSTHGDCVRTPGCDDLHAP